MFLLYRFFSYLIGKEEKMYILLFLLWVALNGRITLEITIFGLVIAGVIYWFMCKFLEYNPKKDKVLLKNGLRSIKYLCVLIIEIIKASLDVLKLIFARKIQIEPQIVIFEAPFKNEFLLMLLANSITLTPGTITVNVEGSTFYVHALDYTLAQGLGNSIFVKLLKEMEDNI